MNSFLESKRSGSGTEMVRFHTLFELSCYHLLLSSQDEDQQMLERKDDPHSHGDSKDAQRNNSQSSSSSSQTSMDLSELDRNAPSWWTQCASQTKELLTSIANAICTACDGITHSFLLLAFPSKPSRSRSTVVQAETAVVYASGDFTDSLAIDSTFFNALVSPLRKYWNRKVFHLEGKAGAEWTRRDKHISSILSGLPATLLKIPLIVVVLHCNRSSGVTVYSSESAKQIAESMKEDAALVSAAMEHRRPIPPAEPKPQTSRQRGVKRPSKEDDKDGDSQMSSEQDEDSSETPAQRAKVASPSPSVSLLPDQFEHFHRLVHKFLVSPTIAVISTSQKDANRICASSFVVVYKLAEKWRCNCQGSITASKGCLHSRSAALLESEVDPILSSEEERALAHAVLPVSPLRLWLAPNDTYKRTLVAVNDHCKVSHLSEIPVVLICYVDSGSARRIAALARVLTLPQSRNLIRTLPSDTLQFRTQSSHLRLLKT